MKVTLPADADAAINEIGGIAALLDKNGWKAAALIAVSVTVAPTRGGNRRSNAHVRLSPVRFAKDLNLKGWSENVIRRHYEAWENAAVAGVVTPAADLVYGEKIDVPTEGWSEWYPPRWEGNGQAEAVAAQAKADGAGVSKAVDIAQNPKAMASAIKADKKVAAAAAQALIDTGDIDTLSRATAAVAKNKQVERNRKRREEGESKAATVEGGAPKPFTPEVTAFMTMKSQSTALRALVTDFPQEWGNLPDEAKTEDLLEFITESFDKIQIALDNCRFLMTGQITDDDLEKLLAGGGE